MYLAVLFGSEDAARMAARVAPMAPVAEQMAARSHNVRRTQLVCREGILCVYMHWCFLTPYHYMFFCECVLFFKQVGMHSVPLGMCICMG